MNPTFSFELRPVGEASAPQRGGEGERTGARVVEFEPTVAHEVPSVKQHVVDYLLPAVEAMDGTGVYTTARADLLPGELGLHAERVARSIHSSSGEERAVELVSRLLDTSHRNALDLFRSPGHGSSGGSQMIVAVFVCVKGLVRYVVVYTSMIAASVPPTLMPPTKRHVAYVVGPPRPRPDIKDISWIRERRDLESRAASAAGRFPDAICCDALLSTENGLLLEGMITNIFVVVATPASTTGLSTCYKLQTAPESMVLAGVARRQVIEACGSLGIPVDLTCPDPSERGSWCEAFLTNSIRRVQSLDGIIGAATNVWGHDAWDVSFGRDSPISKRIADSIA